MREKTVMHSCNALMPLQEEEGRVRKYKHNANHIHANTKTSCIKSNIVSSSPAQELTPTTKQSSFLPKQKESKDETGIKLLASNPGIKLGLEMQD